MKYLLGVVLFLFFTGQSIMAQSVSKEIDYAMYMDDTAFLKLHVNKQNINVCKTEYSILDLSITAGARKCFDWLISHGADVNSFCGGYKTPVGHAVKYGQLGMLKILISKGGDPGFKYRGLTMIELAEEKGKKLIADYLKTLPVK